MWTSSSDVQGALLYPELQMLMDDIKFSVHEEPSVLYSWPSERQKNEQPGWGSSEETPVFRNERPERKQRWSSLILTQVVMRDDKHDAWIHLIQAKTSWLSSSSQGSMLNISLFQCCDRWGLKWRCRFIDTGVVGSIRNTEVLKSFNTLLY